MRAYLLLVTGCGFQLTAGPVDAPAGIDVIDAVGIVPIDTVPPTPCMAKWLDHSVVLTTPMPVFGIDVNNQSERDPTLTSDEKVIFWVGPGGNGNDDLYQAQRGSINATFGTNSIKQSVTDDNFADSKLTLTGDDMLGIQSTQRTGGMGGFDLWQATRTGTGNTAFNAINQMHVGTLNDATDQLDPFVTADGLDLYYAIGTPQRIVVAKRSSRTVAFDAPMDVTGLGAPLGAADPMLSADGRVFLFTSNRAGGFDYADIWYVTRNDVADAFGPPRLVPTINGMHPDGDAFLSTDGCRLYFASARMAGVYDLMLTTVQ